MKVILWKIERCEYQIYRYTNNYVIMKGAIFNNGISNIASKVNMIKHV